jgi:hypothetical protein
MFLNNTIIVSLLVLLGGFLPLATLAQTPTPTPTPTPAESPTPEASETETPETPTEEDEVTTPIPTEPILVLEEEGSLSDGDATLPEDGSLYDIYSFEAKSGQIATISVGSEDFDTYLVLVNSQQEIIAKNDDIAENNTNSELRVVLPNDDTYRVVVNGYDKSDRGNYKITIRIEGE